MNSNFKLDTSGATKEQCNLLARAIIAGVRRTLAQPGGEELIKKGHEKYLNSKEGDKS